MLGIFISCQLDSAKIVCHLRKPKIVIVRFAPYRCVLGKSVFKGITQSFRYNGLAAVVIDLYMFKRLEVIQMVDEHGNQISPNEGLQSLFSAEFAAFVGKRAIANGELLYQQREGDKESFAIADVVVAVLIVSSEKRRCVERDIGKALIAQ